MGTKRSEAPEPETACVAYTGGWSGDLMVPGTPTLDQHQIDADWAATLVETGAYSALPADCRHEQPSPSEVTA
jgi:hypothetical protein